MGEYDEAGDFGEHYFGGDKEGGKGGIVRLAGLWGFGGASVASNAITVFGMHIMIVMYFLRF